MVKKEVIIFLIKFGGIFCILYFGTLAVIGLSVPEGYYSSFIATYFNYTDWLRMSLLQVSGFLLSCLDYPTYMVGKYELYVKNGHGIRMVYSCIGYGIMSFWAAFVIANSGSWRKKLSWLLIGWLALWIINVARITILIIALNKKWDVPLGVDQHTRFNIAAYGLIFLLIYFFDKTSKHPIKYI